jgi:hypothetical protein
MHNDEGPQELGELGIPLWEAGESSEQQIPSWDSEAAAEELCEDILQRQPGLNERELWRALASYRRTGRAHARRTDSVPLASCDRDKLAERIRLLIGRLPEGSLAAFSGLVAFTETFVERAQFLCDLLVYLFCEREKGTRPEGTDGSLYVQFFAQKLSWELDVVSRIAERQSLSRLNDEYAEWLVDRILDGEVLI